MVRHFYIRERIILQLMVLLFWIIMASLAHFSRIDVDYASFKNFYFISGGLYGLALLMIIIKDKYVAPIAEILAAGFAFLVPMFIATYLAYTFDIPLADERLVAMDKGLGFDWMAFIQFIDSSEQLSSWLNTAYGSLKYQLFLTPIFLCLLSQVPRAIAFMFGYALMAIIASTITIWFPAVGTYSIYEIDPTILQHINVKYGYHFLEEFNAVRDGSAFTLSGDTAAGIVTFPSVHAGMGFLIIWALWRTKLLKWPCIILNVSMAVSAISHANHYLVDVIAGLPLAAVVVLISSHIFMDYRIPGSRSLERKVFVTS